MDGYYAPGYYIDKNHHKKAGITFCGVFFSIIAGYFITTNAVYEKNMMYGMKEEKVSVTGQVIKISEAEYGWNLFLEGVEMSENRFHQILVTVDELPQIKIGVKVKIKGKLIHFETARNSGNFDLCKYYMSLGIYSKIRADSVSIIDNKYDAVRNHLHNFKNVLNKRLFDLCGREYRGVWCVCNDKASIFSAILLGDKSELTSEIKNLYSLSGIAHILVVSGLHISFIGMFIYSLLRKQFGFAFSASVSIMIVVGFCLMSGMGIATVRAMIMFGLQLFGEVLGRTYDHLTAISTAGIILMMWNPFVIFNSGFQMSFVAIIAIVLIFPVVQNVIQVKQIRMEQLKIDEKNITKEQKLRLYMRVAGSKVINAVLFSLNVSLIMNPIIAYNYFELPTYSFLLNIIVIPFMSIVIISGLLGIGVSIINLFAGRVFIIPGCIVLELYTKLCILVRKLPFSNVIVGKPPVIVVLIYYLILVCVLLGANRIRNKKITEEKRRTEIVGKAGKIIERKRVILARKKKTNRKFRFAMSCLFCVINVLMYVIIPIVSSGYLPLFEKRLQVTFLDVGQGDGFFIRESHGTTITVDGGSTSVDKVGQYRIIPFLKSQCVRKIDYAIMTHADNDHISGLTEMLKESDNNGIKVKNLVLPNIKLKDDVYNQMIQVANKHGVKVLYIKKGDVMNFGNVEIKCIHPSAMTVADDRNDCSTVLSITYDKFSMLLTGDISAVWEESLRDILESHYTILKVAHHGSKYSTTSAFLERISPDYSVISVGAHNMYGHPSSEVLGRIEQNGSKVLRTDECGGITISTDGRKMRIDKAIVCQ